MQSNDKGKYCLHCEKNVIDFTRLTDTEILKIITQSNGSICGRLHRDQMNRVLVQEEERKVKHFKSNWLAGAILMLGMGEPLIAGSSLNGQKETVSPQQQPTDANPPFEEEAMPPDTLRNFFRGAIVDAETGELLPGVTVRLDSTQIGAITDIEGKFNIRIPADMVTDTMVFTIQSLEYKTRTIHLDKDRLVNDLEQLYPAYKLEIQPLIDLDPPTISVGMIITTKTISSEQTFSNPQLWWSFEPEDLSW
jgi:hypothetical protein